MTGSNQFRIIDSPGLDQDEEEDVTHIKEMIQTIRDQTNFIKLFPIVINGQTRAEQQCTIDTIAMFQEIFGENFWKNAVFVVTHFSNSPEQKENRK